MRNTFIQSQFHTIDDVLSRIFSVSYLMSNESVARHLHGTFPDKWLQYCNISGWIEVMLIQRYDHDCHSAECVHMGFVTLAYFKHVWNLFDREKKSLKSPKDSVNRRNDGRKPFSTKDFDHVVPIMAIKTKKRNKMYTHTQQNLSIISILFNI